VHTSSNLIKKKQIKTKWNN